jgi:tetratricopeptide (TPR) repeat protein
MFMKPQLILIISMLIFSHRAFGQEGKEKSLFDGGHWGVVLEHPDTKKITVEADIPFRTEGGRTLHFDAYIPLGIRQDEVRPTVVFLNGIGDQPNQPGLKQAAVYSSWARLIAAHGYVAITMESEVNRIEDSFGALFRYFDQSGAKHHVDTRAIGTQALSANCREAASYLMSTKVFPGIKAAVLYYGQMPSGPYRMDLPVLFVVAALDIREDNYSRLWTEVLKNKSPWTITIANGMPHAFDAFSDTEVSKRMIMTTISYWINQLGPVPASSSPPSKERSIVAAGYEDTEKLLRLMREWMSEHPDTKDASALSIYAGALVNVKEFAEAEKYLKRSISLNPSNKGNYLNMTVIYYALGNSKEALKQLALYEKNSTPEGFTYGYIANRLIGINKFREAAENYERAISFPNPHTFLYYNLACCYAMLGEKAKAFKNLYKSAELNFGNKAGYEADEQLKSLHTDPKWEELMEKLP